MNFKGYLSTLIIILALFGINWEPSTMPNQKIVVEFDDGQVSFDEAQNALAEVKQRLELIGVKNIRVVKEADGRLKITYFSDVDVASVKQMLAEGDELFISSITSNDGEKPLQLPSEQDFSGFELNIFEIKKSTKFDLDLAGLLLEPAPETQKDVVPADHFVANEVVFRTKDKIDKVAFAIYDGKSLRIDNSSYIIPEVRAGPITSGIS